MSEIRSASSIFLDSGAFSLYTTHVLKKKDASFYTLKKGSEFRRYCDSYGKLMRKIGNRVLFANVDVIYDPIKTWETQQFFEKEYGVQPVPVVHFKTSMDWVDHYLTLKYPIIAVGGFAWVGTGTTKWLDSFFLHICPKPAYLPIVKVHGFALTSWQAITRWPWWSVDSTTWFTTAAFGGIIMPRMLQKGRDWGWDYHRPPIVIQVSARSPQKADLGRHIHSFTRTEKWLAMEWLAECGFTFQEISGEGNKIGRGEDPSYIARSKVNLLYFKNLEESRPKWPYPLNTRIVRPANNNYHKGFGL